eukprot:sb/3463111/
MERLTTLREDGIMKSDPTEILEIIGKAHVPKEDNKQRYHQTKKTGVTAEMVIKDKHLEKAKKAKSPGPENIRNEMITKGWLLLKPHFKYIMTLSLKHNHIPKAWTICKGIIIAKTGKKDYSAPKSFRIISLTSHVLKLMERTILIYLQDERNINAQLFKNQHGFISGRSTITAANHLSNKIEDAMANNHLALGAFLDVEGAFDRVHFHALEKGLDESDIPEVICNWISTCLRNRYITLSHGGERIIWKIERGIPQGGILSPLLWNLCIESLTKNRLINKRIIIIYADDIVIIVTGSDLLCTMKNIVEQQIKLIKTWAESQGLKLSEAKTNVVVFHKPNKKHKLKQITVAGIDYPIKKEAMYLGVILDQHLNFKKHISNKITAMKAIAGPLRRNFSQRWGMSITKAKFIHNQLVMPALTYAATLWGHRILANNTLYQKIQAAQNATLRIITGAHAKTQPAVMHALTGTKPADNHIIKTLVAEFLHLHSNNRWEKDPYHEKRAFPTHAKDMENLLSKTGISIDSIDITPPTPTDLIQDAPVTQWPTITAYTDGSHIKTRNPTSQLTGAGAIIYLTGNTHEIKQPLAPINTINQAELKAIELVDSYWNKSQTTT